MLRFSRFELSGTELARAAGAAVAMFLPTVHQADGWKNMALGQALGDRAAATAAQMAQEPSVLVCAEAVLPRAELGRPPSSLRASVRVAGAHRSAASSRGRCAHGVR